MKEDSEGGTYGIIWRSSGERFRGFSYIDYIEVNGDFFELIEPKPRIYCGLSQSSSGTSGKIRSILGNVPDTIAL